MLLRPETTSLPEPILPQELTDFVIDHLHDDFRSLCSCSLVCRSWTPASHYHLFQRVHAIDENEGFSGFLKRLEEAPNVCKYVQELHLLGEVPENELMRHSWPNQERSQICAHVLFIMLSRLPGIRILNLKCLQLAGSCRCKDLTERLRHGSFVLQRLTFHGTGGPSDTVDHVLSILHLFSEIRELRVLASMPHFALHAPAKLAHELANVVRPSRLQVHSFTSLATPNIAWLGILIGSASIRTLQSLDITCETWTEVVLLGALLNRAGPQSIRTLKIDPLNVVFTTNDMKSLAWERLKLSSCQNLQTLTLPIDLKAEEPDIEINTSMCNMVTDILSFAPVGVREICLQLSVNNDGPEQLAQSMDWTRLERVLLSCRGLKVVTFMSGLFDPIPATLLLQCKVVIEENLSRLKSKGLLVFR